MKGQINQIFVFIMAIVVAGLILLFGIRFIGDYLEKQDQILLTDFINDVETRVSSTSFGSVDISSFRLPKDYEMVCFVDYENSPSDPSLHSKIVADVQSRGGVFGNEFNNAMFLIDTKGTPEENDDSIQSNVVGKVKVSDPYWVCFTSGSGRLSLRFEGVKGGTLVSEDVRS